MHLQLHGRAVLRRGVHRHTTAVLPRRLRHRQQQPMDPISEVLVSPDPVRLARKVQIDRLVNVRRTRGPVRYSVWQRITLRVPIVRYRDVGGAGDQEPGLRRGDQRTRHCIPLFQIRRHPRHGLGHHRGQRRDPAVLQRRRPRPGHRERVLVLAQQGRGREWE